SDQEVHRGHRGASSKDVWERSPSFPTFLSRGEKGSSVTPSPCSRGKRGLALWAAADKISRCPWVVVSQLNCSAWIRTASRDGRLFRTERSPSANAAPVRSYTSVPTVDFVTISAMPPTFVATTGVPHAMASSKTLGQPSLEEANARASAAE